MNAEASGRRVVVVDNDTDSLNLVVIDLTLDGHDVVGTATCGADAVWLCDSLHPDVLVVDYRMPPGITGVDVANAVREHSDDIRVVVYSGFPDDRLPREVARAGATFLPKGELPALRRVISC